MRADFIDLGDGRAVSIERFVAHVPERIFWSLAHSAGVIVRGGTYPDVVYSALAKGGSASRRLRVAMGKHYAGREAQLQMSGLIMETLFYKFDGGYQLGGVYVKRGINLWDADRFDVVWSLLGEMRTLGNYSIVLDQDRTFGYALDKFLTAVYDVCLQKAHEGF